MPPANIKGEAEVSKRVYGRHNDEPLPPDPGDRAVRYIWFSAHFGLLKARLMTVAGDFESAYVSPRHRQPRRPRSRSQREPWEWRPRTNTRRVCSALSRWEVTWTTTLVGSLVSRDGETPPGVACFCD